MYIWKVVVGMPLQILVIQKTICSSFCPMVHIIELARCAISPFDNNIHMAKESKLHHQLKSKDYILFLSTSLSLLA